MAANGTLTPPSLPPAPTPASPSLAKRKRVDTDSAALPNGLPAVPARVPNAPALQTVLEDIVAILKSYDPTPSILDRPITSSISRAASGESDTKRAKLTPPNGHTTIASLVRENAYDSFEALEKDVESATAEALAPLESSERSALQLSLEETRLQTRVLAFRKMARTLLSREEARRTKATAKSHGVQDGVEIQVKEEDEDDVSEGRTVLTLYGQTSNSSRPQQLFSSLQRPASVPPVNGAAGSDLDGSVKVLLPIRDSTLPNIISTTQVYPPLDDADETKTRTKTFGQLFGAPAHLPQLSPPKPAKPLSGKGKNVITFAPQDQFPKPSRKSPPQYATQKLSAGHWLGYGGVDMPKDPASPTAKQKSRQRALSTGEAQLPPSEATLAAVQQAKEDALFRSAYSSFAPCRDDASAIIPEETKNKVWWQKVGQKRFNETFPVDPVLLGLGAPLDKSTDEAENYQKVVDNFTPTNADPFESMQESTLDTDTNEILQEISELLETLASHQRIRNSSLATNPRTPVIQNSSLATLAGSPSTPSTEEIDVYQMLKSQLTLMISQLPPYAVAKLNGDQLEELNISRTIIIETEDNKGLLEEDQSSRRSAVPAAAAAPSLARMGSSGTSTHAQYASSSVQYGRATPSIHSAVRPAQTPQTYYPQQQSVHRSPSVHYPRTAGPVQAFQTPAGAFNSNLPRQTYTAPQYAQPTSRAGYAQPTPGQYYSQRPAAPSNYGGVNSSQYYQAATPTQSRFPAQPVQNGYYSRPQNVPAYNYNASQSSQARTASPLKANQPTYHAPVPGYGTPVSGGQNRSAVYSQGGAVSQFGTPQYAASTPAPPAGFNLSGTNHQQMMLDRQQAQAAAQSQARMAAQGSFHRPGSDTPQAPNSQYPGQPPNGAPVLA
jgi:hypothetical protein